MATVIKCKIDGLSDELELTGGLKFGYTSTAIVNNPTQKITFGPVVVSSFIFAVVEPKPDAAKALVKWLADHEIKNTVTFKISDQVLTAKPREIKLEKACLIAYDEEISETGFAISLSIVGQKVTVNEVPVDQTSQR
jgi:ABC-type glycerol-3-phosphate transport system substrate-binding protein